MFIISVSLTCRVLTGQWRASPVQCTIPIWKCCKGGTGLLTTHPANRHCLCKAPLESTIRPNVPSLLLVSFSASWGSWFYCGRAAGLWWQAALGGRLPGCVNKEAWKVGLVSLWPSICLSPDRSCQGWKNNQPTPPKLLLPCACGTPYCKSAADCAVAVNEQTPLPELNH